MPRKPSSKTVSALPAIHVPSFSERARAAYASARAASESLAYSAAEFGLLLACIRNAAMKDATRDDAGRFDGSNGFVAAAQVAFEGLEGTDVPSRRTLFNYLNVARHFLVANVGADGAALDEVTDFDDAAFRQFVKARGFEGRALSGDLYLPLPEPTTLPRPFESFLIQSFADLKTKKNRARTVFKFCVLRLTQWEDGDRDAALPGYLECPKRVEETDAPEGWTEEAFAAFDLVSTSGDKIDAQSQFLLGFIGEVDRASIAFEEWEKGKQKAAIWKLPVEAEHDASGRAAGPNLSDLVNRLQGMTDAARRVLEAKRAKGAK